MGAVQHIQETAKKLLEEKKADIIIGYKNGLNGITPHIFSNPEQAKELIWNEKCANNLAVYLKEFCRIGKKVAITAKGCDIKSIDGLIKEYQINKDDVFIIALECYKTVNRNGKIFDKCKSCDVNKPNVFNELIQADKQEKIEKVDYWHDLTEFEKKDSKAKEKFWKEQAAKCIRCYACRQACPLCFCEECYADQTIPNWIDPSPSVQGNLQWFHMRSFDLAGRCTGCRECDRVCPADIPWVLLNKAAEKEIKEKFSYDPDKDKLPLFDFKKEDKGEFIL